MKSRPKLDAERPERACPTDVKTVTIARKSATPPAPTQSRWPVLARLRAGNRMCGVPSLIVRYRLAEGGEFGDSAYRTPRRSGGRGGGGATRVAQAWKRGRHLPDDVLDLLGHSRAPEAEADR